MADICPVCHNDREYEHERDGSNMCWCGDVLSLHLKWTDVDELEEVLKKYMADVSPDRLKFCIYPDEQIVTKILQKIAEWREEVGR